MMSHRRLPSEISESCKDIRYQAKCKAEAS
jgi:hypothetical protein